MVKLVPVEAKVACMSRLELLTSPPGGPVRSWLAEVELRNWMATFSALRMGTYKALRAFLRDEDISESTCCPPR